MIVVITVSCHDLLPSGCKPAASKYNPSAVENTLYSTVLFVLQEVFRKFQKFKKNNNVILNSSDRRAIFDKLKPQFTS